MTLEEAKQLKPGDLVLVEVLIDYASVFDEYGNVCLESAYVLPEAIRKKLEPTTRRKFKALDIVFAHDGYWIVGVDEFEDGTVVVGMPGVIKRYKHKDLELICAAENREDAKFYSRLNDYPHGRANRK